MHQLPRLNQLGGLDTQIQVEFRYETWSVSMNAVLVIGANIVAFRVIEEPLASVNFRICKCNRRLAPMYHWFAAALGRHWHVPSHEAFKRDTKEVEWFRCTPQWPADFSVLFRPIDDVARTSLNRWLLGFGDVKNGQKGCKGQNILGTKSAN
jgi:hypothetical protein